MKIWTSDDAESYREINNVPALDEYALGAAEDDIRQLAQWIKTLEPRVSNSISLFFALFNPVVLVGGYI